MSSKDARKLTGRVRRENRATLARYGVFVDHDRAPLWNIPLAYAVIIAEGAGEACAWAYVNRVWIGFWTLALAFATLAITHRELP